MATFLFLTGIVFLLASPAESFTVSLRPPYALIQKPLGSAFAVTCGVNYLDEDEMIQSIRWISPNGVNITDTTGRMFAERLDEATIALYIVNMESSDKGIYTCRVETVRNGISYVGEKNFELSPLVDLRVETESRIVTAGLTNPDAFLGCVAIGSPNSDIQVSWRYQGKRLQKNGRYNVTQNGLLIRDVTDMDAGVYTCRAEEDSTGRMERKDIILHVPGSVVLSLKPSDGKVSKSVKEDYVVTCEVSVNNPRRKLDSIIWIDPQGRDITNGPGRVYIEQMSPLQKTLFLNQISTSDAGYYTCRVETSEKTTPFVDETHFQLQIYDKTELLLELQRQILETQRQTLESLNKLIALQQQQQPKKQQQ